jgi:phage terminase small subunit
MPAPRVPTENLRVKGSLIRNAKLYKDRSDPAADPLGPPSPWLDVEAVAAWHCFVREVPWLLESDRMHLEIACTVRGRLMAGREVGVQALNLLRQCGAQMGCNPSDRSRIKTSSDEGETDPTAGYFQ